MSDPNAPLQNVPADDATASARHLKNIGLENFAPYLMNRIMGRYNAGLREELALLGLTTPQMRALAVLSVFDGILIGELAVYAVVEKSTLSRALDALRRDKMVRRETDAEDSRATRIFLTDQGRKVFARMWPHMSAFYDQMFAGISDKDRHIFVATLQAMLLNIRQHDF
ncbi:MAG: MarR family transcriptional regulator [Rhodobacteraceae bacterium]|nr:MarR family transcriptional regulator [Paracoccaceae bacterium]